jgi:hypothetical protein
MIESKALAFVSRPRESGDDARRTPEFAGDRVLRTGGSTFYGSGAGRM